MSASTKDCGVVALVIDLLDGNTTPARAACGLPDPFLNLFGVAEKLGRLDRGETIEFSPVQCALLGDILDWSCEQERLGKTPSRSEEVLAAMIKRVAFESVGPSEWARNLPRAILGNRSWKVARH